MQEILLVNPRRRRRKKGSRAASKRTRRSGRSAAQRAATRKLLAFNRARRKGSAAPKRRRARRKSAKRSTSVINFTGAKMSRRRRRKGSRAVSRRRRKNPSSGGGRLSFRRAIGNPMNFLKPALIGAIGAVAVNTAMSRLVPMLMPVSMQATFMTGRIRYLTQGVAAIGLGIVAQRVGVRAAMAEKMAEGSLTVTLTDAIRDLALQAGIPLGGMGYYLPGRNAGRAVPSASGNPGLQLGRISQYVSGPGSGGNVTPMRRQMAGLSFGPGRTF